MTPETLCYPIITQSGFLASLPKWNRLPHELLFALRICIARKDYANVFRLLDANVEEFADLHLYCKHPERVAILINWVRDSQGERVS